MIDLQFEQLKANNYVRVAKPKNNYWVDFSRAKLFANYINKFGSSFNIVLYPKTNSEADFYIIPFFILQDLFKDNFLAKDKTRTYGSRRWVVTVTNHKFKVSNCPNTIDVKEYYSNATISTPCDFLDISIHDVEAQRDEEDGRFEGDKKRKLINYYERNAKLRAEAIKIHGTICKVCKFDFKKTYGVHGESYIEVHHLVPLSSLINPTLINPKSDMTVVCANCHRMIHRRKNNSLSINALKKMLKISSLAI